MDTNATLPSVGQTWLADPGPDTPLGHFTGGTIKGNTEKMNYTTAKLRDGLIPAAEIMEVLPAAVRIREATRVLGLAKIREREAQVLVWSAYRAWPGPNQFGSAADGTTFLHQRSPSGNACAACPSRTEMRRRPGRAALKA